MYCLLNFYLFKIEKKNVTVLNGEKANQTKTPVFGAEIQIFHDTAKQLGITKTIV